MAITIDGALSKCCSTVFATLSAPNSPANLVKAEVAKNQFVNALKSPANVSGATEIFAGVKEHWGKDNPYAGSNATLKVWANVPDCLTASDISGAICDVGSAPTERRKQIDVQILNGKMKSGSITKTQMDSICREGINEILASELANAALAIIKARNSEMVSSAYDIMGKYTNNVASKTSTAAVNILNTQNNTVIAQPMGFTRITRSYERMQTSGNPIMVGGYKLQDYLIARGQAGLGAQSLGALNPGADLGLDSYFDNSIDRIVNAEKSTSGKSYAITWAPGAMLYLEHFDFYQYPVQGSDSKRLVLNIGGELFDFFLKWEDCEGRYIWNLKKRFDLFYYPDAMYSACGATWNHKQLFELGCGTIDCNIDLGSV